MNLESIRQHCPYCGEVIELLVDPSAGPQRYTEDCEVCCRPMVVCVEGGNEWSDDGLDAGLDSGGAAITVLSEDEAGGL